MHEERTGVAMELLEGTFAGQGAYRSMREQALVRERMRRAARKADIS